MVAAYLNRIGLLKEEVEVSAAGLQRLHAAHVFSIPFENLDIHTGRSIELDIAHLKKKIVDDRRGGFCYELNYLFHHLLTSLGFDADILAARIFRDDLEGPEFDHMCIWVRLEEDWLVDVGYGNLFIQPLRLNRDAAQQERDKAFKIERQQRDHFLLWESDDGVDFFRRYSFRTIPVEIASFGPQCQLKQTSQDSYFVQNLICTIPTPAGRKSIFNCRFTEKDRDTETETVIQDEFRLNDLLEEHFDLKIDGGIHLSDPDFLLSFQ
ncbi:MAG: arylamine N-acetyltransferase [Bacteroidota bacterium]